MDKDKAELIARDLLVASINARTFNPGNVTDDVALKALANRYHKLVELLLKE
jgi:hypothetical protein